MFEISGYKIGEIIYKSEKSSIYRAIRNFDNKKVLIKLQNNEYPTAEELHNINKEYMFTSKNYGDKVIKVYDIKKYKNSIAMILEDFGARSLSEFLKIKKLDLKKKLFIAVNIADALVQIHKQGVIHKDINPSNIVWNFETDEIKIIDFGLSAELINENCYNSHTFEGTCLYISPEQTGKINRPVDFRSDLYSTGATLYELFTGKPPFDGDELEIIHSHIAKTPVEPKVVSNEIPPIISDIIMKLLSKNAEDRYQTAAGLKYDLKYCLENFYSRENIFNFQIAQKDMSSRFVIPQKLYGRENDINKIKSFLNSEMGNCTRILLITGYSGIGKTALIQEINQEVICNGDRFVSGKFEQFERTCPYSAIKAALGMLIKNLVLETKKLDFWKSFLEKALNKNAGVLVEFLPELEYILGKQQEICKMEPVEKKNRFTLALTDFLNVFTHEGNRLILFLDDLQWSDLSSIDLLKYLLSSNKINNLIIIGSYRDNEVKDGHLLLSMLDDVKKNATNSGFFFQHKLEPIQESSVNQLIADTLKTDCVNTSELTNYIYQKTRGNPFFVNQLLKTLYENGLFKFNEENSTWEWCIDNIRDIQISDNVVDFLIQNLRSLPSGTLNLLKLASCIGNDFNLDTIFQLYEEKKKISDDLQNAIIKEYILPLSTNYNLFDIQKENCLKSHVEIKLRFTHSRIQQAAYSLVSDKDKESIHYKIGKLLLDSYNNSKISECKLIDIVNHLNLGRKNIHTNAEKLMLLELNYKAGNKAKRNLAYDIAKNYYFIGKNIFTDMEWREFPGKLFDLSLEYIESCYLCGNLESIFDLCDNALTLASNDIEKARVYELKAKILDYSNERREIIIAEIKKGLALFGIDLPECPTEINTQIDSGIKKMLAYLSKNSIDELVNLPEMNDANKIMVMKLLFQLSPIAFEFFPPLHTLIQLLMFDITINFGVVGASCKNFAETGITLGPVLGNYGDAYKFNKVAFSLIDKYKNEALRASVYFIFATFISHWKKHYSEGLEYFDLSIKSGTETGDIIHSFWANTYKLDHLFFIGTNLKEYKLELEKTEKLLASHNAMLLLPFVSLMKHVVNQFQSAYNFEMENYILVKIKQENNMTGAFKFGHFNVIINFILGNYDTAFNWVEFTETYIQAGTGLFCMSDYIMFSSLCYIKKYEKESDEKKATCWRK